METNKVHSVATKPPQILPSDQRSDRALFHVIIIFTLLFTLTLISLSSGLRAASNWGQSLSQSVTVQVKTPGDAALNTVLNALSAQPEIEEKLISEDDAKDLLKPWLGDAVLPDDLPIPRLIDIHFETDRESNIAALRQTLSQLDIETDLDDHTFWIGDLRHKTRIFQAAILLAGLLILSALISAIIFATRSGLTGWRTLMNVMDHIGAEPKYTARLFAVRFFSLSLKAGILGAAGALFFTFFMSLLWLGSSFLPEIGISKPIVIFSIMAPVLVASLSAGTAWRTVYRVLMKRLYP